MASDQIRQMVNFILQEAHEKANEIRVKTEHDFNLEKQTLVHEAKLSVQEEFAKKEKDREVQERIARSAEIGECRVKKMRLRDGLLNQLTAEAAEKCGMVARGQNYPHLLQKLIVQGLIKIEEISVVIYTRAEDVSVVQQILPDAISEYVDIMERESGIKLKPNVTVSEDPAKVLGASTQGGVILTARDGRIVCDNTMQSRLTLVYSELLPSIRAILFPEAA
uniref:V-type proton ATPase subunit E n=1 Tax=Ditylum brightwellii TaxID=49249 RepID=A0A6U3VEJ0_9STRA|mmetsp:Transcript_38023/g.56896  ORF Transcript_38023/g.56896 Transcript_38023/m.56896 type:complete len:222 (+) Transcript_38023:131-796(+)